MTTTLEKKTEQEKDNQGTDISMENQGNVPYEEKLRRYHEFVENPENMKTLLGWSYNKMGHKQDAEDVLQKSLIRAYKTLPKFRFECSLSSRMYDVIRSVANHMYRKRKVRHHNQTIPVSHTENLKNNEEGNIEWILESPESSGPDHIAALHEENKIVEREFKKINKSYSETLELRSKGYDYRTIAKMKGVEVGTVKSQISRGRKNLLDRLRGKGIEVNSN